MTEAEWLACTDFQALWQCLFKKLSRVSGRKMRFFGCACCRRIWHLLIEDASRRAVEVSEDFADGRIARKELAAIRAKALAAVDKIDSSMNRVESVRSMKGLHFSAAKVAAECALANGIEVGDKAGDRSSWIETNLDSIDSSGGNTTPSDWGEFWKRVLAKRSERIPLFRDLFGNPFQPARINPGWLRWNGSTVAHLAQAAYDERTMPSGELDKGKLGILADALEDAGCTNADILDHLRDQGNVHVRGCWVIDLLLQRA